MNTATERALIELNNRFYREHADTFSATRQAPWPGWERLMDLAAERIGAQSAPVILDLACGNLRFERFCLERLGGAAAVFHAVDASAELAALAPSIPGAHCWQVDLLDELQAGRDPLPGLAPAHFTVCFGFLHHVPGARLRGELLDLMAHTTAPGGIIALSLWRFMDDPRLAAKAATADALAEASGLPHAELEPGDHYLGWQDDPRPLRFCHHFDDEEIDACAQHLARAGAVEIARYDADGRSGALNRYLVFRKD